MQTSPQLRPAESRTRSRSATRKPGRHQAAPAASAASFSLSKPGAITASIAGTFNAWDPKRTPMRKDQTGVWKAQLSLPPGRYEYRFVVDGEWMTDPGARESTENPFGEQNSVLTV